MKNIWIICRKELRSYFVSPVAYLMLALFTVAFGFFFWNSLGFFLILGMESQLRGQSFPMNLNDEVVRPLLINFSFIGLLLIPLITMRLFAEEKRTGTIELLATSPVRDVEVIVGKWLAALGLYGFMLLLCGLNFIFLFIYGKPDWKPLALGYLGLLLEAGGLLALGTLISTMTKNQIIAGGVTFFVCLLLWLLSWFTASDPNSSVSQVINYLSIITHFDNFSKGLLSTKDVVFYLSMIYFALFLTSRSMESLRWRA